MQGLIGFSSGVVIGVLTGLPLAVFTGFGWWQVPAPLVCGLLGWWWFRAGARA